MMLPISDPVSPSTLVASTANLEVNVPVLFSSSSKNATAGFIKCSKVINLIRLVNLSELNLKKATLTNPAQKEIIPSTTKHKDKKLASFLNSLGRSTLAKVSNNDEKINEKSGNTEPSIADAITPAVINKYS